MTKKPNNLIIAAAGAGKTTYLVQKALEQKNKGVLITTFTEGNEQEIKNKFLELNGSIPHNIVIQTWFSFVLQQGIKPYQGGVFDNKVSGMILVNSPSVMYIKETDTRRHYFTNNNRIYSDKLAKFSLKVNKFYSGAIIDRLSSLYPNIYIDEIQDLASYDLDIVKLLLKSTSRILLVGDPRQVTYLTHHASRYKKYKHGLIKNFIEDECNSICSVDEELLSNSYRNCSEICEFASLLYPNFEVTKSNKDSTTKSIHKGVFVINPDDVQSYIAKFKPVSLFYQMAKPPDYNYGGSKGMGFHRVLIYPTKPIEKYLRDGKLTKLVIKKKQEMEVQAFDIAKFYVAITRAEESIGIVTKYTEDETFIDGIQKWR